MNITEWRAWLKSKSACADGYLEAKDKTPDEWYQYTSRPDWMMWVLCKLPQHKDNKALWVRVAIASAKSVAHLTNDPERRPQKAIEAAEAWLDNPTEGNKALARAAADATDAAADAAADAVYAVYAAAYAAAYAADAAAYAADAAAYAADAAAYAADAANAAAYAAAYATAADTATDAAARKAKADIIRTIIPHLEMESK